MVEHAGMNTPGDWEMVELAALAVQGDDWARAGLIAALWPTVQAVCRRSVEADAAADVSQDAMERIVVSLGQFRGEGSIEGWARRIARSVSIDHLRRRQRHDALLERIGTGPDRTDEPETELGDTLAVRQLLDGLEEHQRSAFAATQLAGLSYAEAATRAGCPVGTIRTRVARARIELRRQLGPA